MGWIICWSVAQTPQSGVHNDTPWFIQKLFAVRFCHWVNGYDMSPTLSLQKPLVVEARQEVNSQAKDMALQGGEVINFNCTLEGYVFSKVLWHRWDISNPWPDGTCFSLLPMKCFHRTVDSVDFQWHNSVIQDLRFLRKVANGLNTFMLLHLGQAILSWTYKYPI